MKTFFVIDDMFQNFSLQRNNSFSNNDVKSMQKSPSSVSSPTQNDKMFEKPFSMSFEEKKTLTWNQEQHRKWKNISQGEGLVPFRDTTSSLINSNLQGLTTSKALDSLSSLPLSTSYIPNNWSPNTSQQSMSLIGTNQKPMSFAGTPQQPMSFIGTPQQPMLFMGTPQQPMSLGGTYPSMATSPPQHSHLQQQSSLDMKSLDSLLPSIGSRSNLTLSQMSRGIGRPGVRNAELPSSPVVSNFVKPPDNSAKNDLDDLLG